MPESRSNILRQYFDSFSIRQLLTIWATGCVIILLILALVIHFSSKIIYRDQNILFDQAIPLEMNNTNITRIITELLSRQSNIITAESLDQYIHYKDRSFLDGKFYRYFSEIEELVKINEEAQKVLSELRSNYTEYQLIDDRISGNKLALLELNKALRKNEFDLEDLINKILVLLDELNGKIHLEISKDRADVRSQIKQDVIITDNLKQQLEGLYIGTITRIQNATLQIQQNINEIILQSKKLRDESKYALLLSIKDNELIQRTDSFKISLDILKGEETDAVDMKAYITSLEQAYQTLIAILIEDEQSLFNLKKETLLIEEKLRQDLFVAEHTIKLLLAGLDQLTNITAAMSSDVYESTREHFELTMIIVVIICGLVAVLVLLGISMIQIRIAQPLNQLRNAMHQLSNGILNTRLDQKIFAKDEFIDLISDFNKFADSNEMLIQELSMARDQIRDREQHTRAILENALVGIAHLIDRKFVSVNKRFEEMFGYQRQEIDNLYTEIIFTSKENFIEVGEHAYPLLRRGETYRGEWMLKKKDGTTFWCTISAKSIEYKKPEKGTIWLFEDITEQKQSEAELKLLANYDSLSGLPNRSLFMDRVLNAVEHAKRGKTSFAVLFIDLDRFKHINDSLGHETGDQLLKHVARNLQAETRSSDTVARLGGDEFTMLLPDTGDRVSIEKIAQKILDVLSKPVVINEHELSVTPSIGISIYPDDGTDVSTLIQNADAAMYHAKASGRNNFQFYNEDMNKEAYNRLTMEHQLRTAMEKGEFVIYYQPYVNANSRNIAGYEALLRWQSNQKLILPGEFIPVLEDTGMITQVGEWVCKTACEKIMQLNTSGAGLTISVNMSPRQFHSKELIKNIKEILHETGMEPGMLNLEITESLLLEGSEQNRRVLYELYDFGINITLDDFGTGYSSLAYLKRFPIDIIKIDQSFVRDILTDPNDAAICEAIIDIAQRLHIRVIAEGVESEQQYKFLLDRGCHYMQGYLFGKPALIEDEDVDAVLRQSGASTI